MRKQTVRLPGYSLETDVCIPCSLVWLDGGELALAQLGHETKAGFLDAQEMKRRIEELEVSPERKAEFEKNLARLRNAPDLIEEFSDNITADILEAIIRRCIR